MTYAYLFIGSFVSMVALDYIWAMYTIYLVAKRPVLAGTFASGLMLVNSLITLGYVNEPTLIAPLMVGAFVGTYLAVRFPLPGH